MYTCDEVAERYKVKVITVWEWIRKKKLNAIKLGREYRVYEEDLIKFENERKTMEQIGKFHQKVWMDLVHMKTTSPR